MNDGASRITSSSYKTRGVDLDGNVGGLRKDPLPRSLPPFSLLPSSLPLLPTLSLPSLRSRTIKSS